MPNPILVGTQLLDSQAVEVDPGVRYPGGATQNCAVDRGRGGCGGPCVGGVAREPQLPAEIFVGDMGVSIVTVLKMEGLYIKEHR